MTLRLTQLEGRMMRRIGMVMKSMISKEISFTDLILKRDKLLKIKLTIIMILREKWL